jgi:hypothetical protein
MSSIDDTVKGSNNMSTWHVAPMTFTHDVRVGDPPTITNIPVKQESRFFKQISQLIPKIKPPTDIEIGGTGYPEMSNNSPTDLFGWFYDEFNRELFVVGNYLVFQRYTGGDSHRYRNISNNQGWNFLNTDKENELIELATLYHSK